MTWMRDGAIDATVSQVSNTGARRAFFGYICVFCV